MVANLYIPGPVLTVKQYREMERQSLFKHEYVDGHVYAMAGGTRRHGAISANIIAVLSTHLVGMPCQVNTSDVSVQLMPTRFVYPDASISYDVRDSSDSDDEDGNSILYPRLVLEVLSRSTERYDRAEKFALYRANDTLRDYVLVETAQQAVEVRHRGDDDVWHSAVYRAGDIVVLDGIGIRVPVASFYSGLAWAG